MTVSISSISFFCSLVFEFGEKVSATYGEINIVLDQLTKYLLPNGTWKILSTILIVSQESVGFDNFESIS